MGATSSKTEESLAKIKNTNNVAKAILRTKNLDPELRRSATLLKNTTKRQLTERKYTEYGYLTKNFAKTATFLNLAMPGSGIIATNMGRGGTIQNLYKHRQELTTSEIAQKAFNEIVVPAAKAAAFSYAIKAALPFVKAALTDNLTTVAIATGVVAGTVLAVDVVYSRYYNTDAQS